MALVYEPLDTELVRALREGAPDANGQPAERGAISDGQACPAGIACAPWPLARLT